MNTDTDVALIQPKPVERDKDGWWVHPDIPDLGEDWNAYRAWIDAQGLHIEYMLLHDEAETHPAFRAYFEDESCDISAWDVAPPRGEGWFVLSINDSEDGPVWVWARRWIVVPA